MRRATGISVACAALVATAIGCGSDSSGADPQARTAAPAKTTAASDESPPSSARRRPTVTVRKTRYGRMLFDGRGRALYLFTRDGGTQSRCYGACATAWPPYLRKGTPKAGKGAKTSLLGTTRRSNGKTQLTYAGHPLYYYVGDRKPGQVLCQDVEEYGGHWYVVSPAGAAIR